MRTTKYDYICLMRYATFGGYDPITGQTNPTVTLRQELWVRAFFRPDKQGNEFVPFVVDATSNFVIYNEKNLGTLFIRDIPKWPMFASPYRPTIPVYPANIYAWWPVQRTQFDSNAPATNFNWVKFQGLSNTTVGTRFSKHYEAKLASLIPTDVVPAAIGYAPESSAPLTVSFEQAEQRLHTVIQIGDKIVNPKE